MTDSRAKPIDLVPVGERMRMITWFRLAAAAVIVIATWIAPGQGAAPESVTAVVVGYLLAAGLVEFLWRRAKRPWPSTFGVLAMADSVLLAWCSYGAHDIDSPLRYLLVVQLITFSLLASFRTGLKLALFTTWLIAFGVYAGGSSLVAGLASTELSFGDDTFWHLAADIALLLTAAIVTATFASVNERELRRSRFDLNRLAELSLELDDADSPVAVGEAVLAGMEDVYDCSPSLFLSSVDGRWDVLASRTEGEDDGGPEALSGLVAPVIDRALEERRILLVARAGTQDDPFLQTFGRASNVIIIPLNGPGKARSPAAIVAEYPVRRGSRIERRMVGMLERYASHADLELTNASLLDEVRAAAVTDPLTSLANRRQLDRVLEEACDQVSRGHGSLGLMMIDIDHFKKLNDTHGHQTGDDVLRKVAATIANGRSVGELAARYGGEEFSVVLPGVHGNALMEAAETLRRSIAEMGGAISVTVSVGVASAPMVGFSREELIASADAALYRAKEGGRNRVAAGAPSPAMHQLEAS